MIASKFAQHSRRKRAVFGIVLAAATLSACGTVSGTPAAGEPDVSTFDNEIGDYSPEPTEVADPRTQTQGIALESMRLGDAVAAPSDIDPTLDDNWLSRVGTVLTPDEAAGDLYNNLFAGVARPVIERHGLLGGFVVSGSDVPLTPEGDRAANSSTITMTVLRFPDDAAAEAAAREIDQADFDEARDLNQKVQIPGYPEANSHWRPNIASLAATTAHGPFVVDVFVFRPAPDLNALTGMVRKAYDAQFPLLDEFKATPEDEIADLPADPYGVFERGLSTSPGGITVDGHENWAYGPKGFAHFLSKDDRERLLPLLTEAGVVQVSATKDGSVIEARDDAATTKLQTDVVNSTDTRKQFDSPAEIKDSTICFEDTAAEPDGPQFGCYVRYRTYLASVTSDDKKDLSEKAIAQYAVLANSTLR
ncbi:hypothetical protein [Antrihabitans sp. YC2-6]|uniref:DUF7373 family lipoprotein n=1 Tax=Antrihabitans sp. YC2-6 TaxID=2799498 RepID=UPI0018F796F6|nr:hypothetical protein [Antrihabitans sp. YC2-6]MBJ8347832.1 hypothetical protein [Antrihabitans sp. YC2-6]